jgi:hypothetical protein
MTLPASTNRNWKEKEHTMNNPTFTAPVRQSAGSFPQAYRRPVVNRRCARWIAAVLALLPFAFCLRTWGQYSIDWQTIDGGGGTSTGGVYSVSGTIGQPDAGTMSGGNYTLQGGFWGVIAAVQTPGAPLLTVTLNSQLSTINVSWPSPSTGWTLQQNTNSISSLNWSNVTATIQDDGTTKTLLVNPPTGNRFYRLKK